MSGGVASVLPPLLACYVLALLWGLGLSPSRALAESEDDRRARAHFAAGQEYYENGRYTDAAQEFAEAYQLSGRPEMLINRARSEQRAGNLEQAIAALELLFERHPQTSYRAEAEGELEKLRAERAQLAPTETSAPATAPSAPAAGPRASETEPSVQPVRIWPPRLPTLIVGGALVASVLVSVGTGWAAHTKYKYLEDNCRNDRCPDDGHDYAGDKQRGTTLSRVSTGFTFASLALAAATSVLWVYDVKAQKGLSLGVRTSLAGADAQLHWVY
jgi:tetratricopeptide (TPR) repeat protein